MPKSRAKDGLTDKQRAFVEAYADNGFTSTLQAALQAGYAKSCASVVGCTNIRKSNVAAAIAAKKAERQAEAKYTREIIEQWHADIARRAAEKGDYPTETRNVELLGRMQGLYIDRQDRTERNITALMLTEEQWAVKQAQEAKISSRLRTIGHAIAKG